MKGATVVEIYLLEQLVALADCGTLHAASEKLHLTQPTLTRSMQKIERECGVPLFERSKGRVALNENGELAVSYARRILEDEDEMLRRLEALERSRHSVALGSVSPGPIAELLPLIVSLYPDQSVSSHVASEEQLFDELRDGSIQLAVITSPLMDGGFRNVPCGSERLYYCFDRTEYPTGSDSVRFADLDGRSILMPGEIGLWDAVIRREMPNATFIRQTDNTAVDEVVQNSTLPAFATDLGLRLSSGARPGRIAVPIVDDAARVSFWCVCKEEDARRLETLFDRLSHPERKEPSAHEKRAPRPR